MPALKLKAEVPEDHQLELAVQLPADFPRGPAEVLVQSEAASAEEKEARRRERLKIVDRLRGFERSEEEALILDEFPEFLQQFPVVLSGPAPEGAASFSIRIPSTIS